MTRWKSVLAVTVLMMVGGAAKADVLAQWTFENNPPEDLPNSPTGPAVSADSGVGYLVGFHVSANTDWTTPAGNGSDNSYSVNTWAIGDYFQFSSNSLHHKNVVVSFDASSSNTGPQDFKLQYSTDGSAYFDSGFSYVVLANGSSPYSPWSVTAGVQSAYSYTADLSALTVLNHDASIFFRLVMTTSDPAKAGSVFGPGGASRIDNVTISAVAAPEPGGFALAGFGALLVGAGVGRSRSAGVGRGHGATWTGSVEPGRRCTSTI